MRSKYSKTMKLRWMQLLPKHLLSKPREKFYRKSRSKPKEKTMQFVLVNGTQQNEAKMYLRAVKSCSGILTVEISLTEDFIDSNQLLSVAEVDGKLRVVTHT